MKIIIRGETVYIDKEDYHFIEEYTWYVHPQSRGLKYVRTMIDKKVVALHRLIANTPDGMFTDHINGNSLDNRRVNLRACTRGQNQANSRKKLNNKSGYKGVVKLANGKYQAKINKDKKRYHLGMYETPQEAAKAYDKAASRLHGQFARTNF